MCIKQPILPHFKTVKYSRKMTSLAGMRFAFFFFFSFSFSISKRGVIELTIFKATIEELGEILYTND